MIKTVLYIDDDPEDIFEIFSVFRELQPGIGLQGALSGEEGVSSVGAECPDLILLDYNMPKMNGTDVLKHLRRFSDCHSKIVMYSTYMLDRQVEECISMGASGYFKKPGDIADMRRIAQLLIREGE